MRAWGLRGSARSSACRGGQTPHDWPLDDGHAYARPGTIDADADAPLPTSHAHAHAHAPAVANAHEGWGPEAATFPHERLDGYRVALRMAGLATMPIT